MPKRIEMTEQSSAEKRPMTTIERSLFEGEVVEQIRTVFDPEIPINVYDLGLIYDIQVDDDKNVHILMTLTSPACPVAGSLPGEVEEAAKGTPGVGNVTVELTWDPPFTVDMMSEEAKLMLGLM
jgi:FeS assembly SUF system protein